MIKNQYIFDSKEAFIDELEVIDIYVPLRSKGRKTEHTERYSIVSFLKEFYTHENFLFPFTLIHQDKPDFLLTNELNKIGIEFTESIPEQLARASSLLDIHFPAGGKLEPEFFGWDAPDRTNDEIIEILKRSNKRLIGQGYSGKSIEEKWLLGIKGCISNKTNTLNKDGFSKYHNNWLLIYDNQTKVFLDIEYVTRNINPFLTTYWASIDKYQFDKIFIDSGSVFYVFDTTEREISRIIIKSKTKNR